MDIDNNNSNDPMGSDVPVVTGTKGYPFDYFDCETGKAPSTAAEAEKFWPYRHHRPLTLEPGEFDIPPDGEKMLREMTLVREGLRDFVADELVYGILDGFNELQITTPHDNQLPQFGPDIRRIIATWSNTKENQRLVYTLFHHFHRERMWLCATVDKYLYNWNMFLYPEVVTKKKKKFDTRGGWGTVARRSKSQELRKYMNCLINAQDWNISTTKTSSAECENHYSEVSYGEYYSFSHPKKDDTLFWVVTRKKASIQQINVSKTLDSYFTINYDKLMNDIIKVQEESNVNALPPAQLRQLLIMNSKIDKKNQNKLLKTNIDVENGSLSDECEVKDDNDDDDDDVDDIDDDNNKKMSAATSTKKATKNGNGKCKEKLAKKKSPPPTSPIKPASPHAKKVPRFPVQHTVTSPTPPAKSTKEQTSTETPTTSPTKILLCAVDHAKMTNYNPNSDRNYFLPGYYKKYPKCTQQCARCGDTFGIDKKVTTKSPAMCCINQFHVTIKCPHAYCTPCYGIKMGYSSIVNDTNKENESVGEYATNNFTTVNM